MVPTIPFDINMMSEFFSGSLEGVVFIMVSAVIAGLLAGKLESDAAKAGTGDKTRENVSLADWAEDAGYGFLGAVMGLGLMQVGFPIPIIFLPIFGYGGRKLIPILSERILTKATDGLK